MSVVTVVVEDKTMCIDGDPMSFDLGLDDNIWAIQWDGSKGHIEYNDGSPNKDITEFPELESLIAKHKQAAIDYLKICEPVTYEEFRVRNYPMMEDQLDDLYHNGIDGWKSTIKSIKDKFPKP